MRTFAAISFSLLALVIIDVPSAQAACVEDAFAGTWYDNTTGNPCPQSGSNTVQTQSGSNTTGTTLINPLNTGECSPNENCLMNFLNKILEFVIKIGTVVVTLMTVYVGYLFVVARGAPEKIKDARNALMWTVIGALILLGSQAIAIAIKATVQAVSVGQ